MKYIWGLAGKIGMNSEELHLICKAITGKDSLKSLNSDDYDALISELNHRKVKLSAESKKKSYKTSGMSQSQCRKAFALIYRLSELSPSLVSPCERLCGVIRKVTSKLSLTTEPFEKLNSSDGVKVINALNRYIKSARRKEN